MLCGIRFHLLDKIGFRCCRRIVHRQVIPDNGFEEGFEVRVLPHIGKCDTCETVLDQLYQAYAESHESDPTEIGDGFKELEEFLHTLPLEDNNAVFNLCCRLCSAYERKAFQDGLQYGVHLIQELK